MGFPFTVIEDEDRADFAICCFCREIIEDAVSVNCCGGCCRGCHQQRRQEGGLCVCESPLPDTVDDEHLRRNILLDLKLECKKCHEKPIRYENLERHSNECRRRMITCDICRLEHEAAFSEICERQNDPAVQTEAQREVQREQARIQAAYEALGEENRQLKLEQERAKQENQTLQLNVVDGQRRFDRVQTQNIHLQRDITNIRTLPNFQEPRVQVRPVPINQRPNNVEPAPRAMRVPLQPQVNGYRKVKIGVIQDRYGTKIAPKFQEIEINDEDDLASLRLKIRKFAKIGPPYQLFFNGHDAQQGKLIGCIDPVERIDEITVGIDGVLWIDRKI